MRSGNYSFGVRPLSPASSLLESISTPGWLFLNLRLFILLVCSETTLVWSTENRLLDMRGLE